jgi:hypothetical protein
VKNFNFTDSAFVGVSVGMSISLNYGDDPNPPLTHNFSALPELDGFLFARTSGTGIGVAGSLSGEPGKGLPGVTITGVSVIDVDLGAAGAWYCANVSGSSFNVTPQTCPELQVASGRS